MRDENYYKNETIKMIQKINRVDILNYLETFIRLYVEKWG